MHQAYTCTVGGCDPKSFSVFAAHVTTATTGITKSSSGEVNEIVINLNIHLDYNNNNNSDNNAFYFLYLIHFKTCFSAAVA